MININHVLCCFIDFVFVFVFVFCFFEQVFQRLGFCLLKVRISLIVHNQNIYWNRTRPTLTTIMVMKWGTWGFQKVLIITMQQSIITSMINVSQLLIYTWIKWMKQLRRKHLAQKCNIQVLVGFELTTFTSWSVYCNHPPTLLVVNMHWLVIKNIVFTLYSKKENRNKNLKKKKNTT